MGKKSGIKNKLAIHGGIPVRSTPFPGYPLIGEEEVNAVSEVVRSGKLSMFDLDFLGGEKVRTFEENFACYHGVRFGISVNSGTAALHVALAALQIGPGDEVIVPPYTFTATATSVLMNNAVPVFTDVCLATANLDPEKLEEAITPRTRAIIPVHLLGHPAEMDTIIEIAKAHNLFVIEDCAQSPGAEYKGKKTGTFGDLGAFSFQRTKNMTTGEGGMIITDDKQLAHRCRLVRNHGEAFSMGQKREYLANVLGWNYRMTEMEAAIGIEQLKKLDIFNQIRVRNSHFLTKGLTGIDGITPAYEASYVKHVYSTYALQYNEQITGIPKPLFIKALIAEGIPIWNGYPHPLYKNPIFKEKIVHGTQGCPFSCSFYKGTVDYVGIRCPVTEDLCNSVFGFSVIRPPSSLEDMDDIITAVKKILSHKDEFAAN
jgi:dTDP-4-amino-4,6-dideoxygalactose transaminase